MSRKLAVIAIVNCFTQKLLFAQHYILNKYPFYTNHITKAYGGDINTAQKTNDNQTGKQTLAFALLKN